MFTSTYSYTFKGSHFLLNAYQVLVLNSHCAKNDSGDLLNFLSNSVLVSTLPGRQICSGKRASQLQHYNPITPCMTWVFEEKPKARCVSLCPE